MLGSLVGLVVKNLHANAGDTGSIPGLRRSPGEGNGNPLQYFCLRNPMERSLAGCSPRGRKEMGIALVTKQDKNKHFLRASTSHWTWDPGPWICGKDKRMHRKARGNLCEFFQSVPHATIGFPQWLSSKESACSAQATGDVGPIPGSRRSPEGGK